MTKKPRPGEQKQAESRRPSLKRKNKQRPQAVTSGGQATTPRTSPSRGTQGQPHQLPPERIQKARHPLFALMISSLIIGSIVAGLWILSSSGVVTRRFKPQLEVELSKALSRTVTVDKIEGGLFDRVVLKGITISSPEQKDSLAITIDRVVVQYSLWDILVRKRPLAESLHQIQLIKPLIEFKRSPEGKWQGPSFQIARTHRLVAGPAAPAPFTFPKIKIMLYDGELRLLNQQASTSIKKIRGMLNVKDPMAARLYLSGKTDEHRRQNIKLSGIMDLTANVYRLNLEAMKMKLRPIERVIKVSEDFELASGEADLNLKIRSRSPRSLDLIPGAELKGRIVLYDAAVKTNLTGEMIRNLYGVVAIDNRDLNFKNVQALLGKTSWTGSGWLRDLQNPMLDLQVKSERLELADLTKSLPRFQRLNTSGAAQAQVRISGRLPQVAATLNLKMDAGKIGQVKIRHFESISKYQSGELNLLQAKGVLARGWIEGSGKIILPEGQDDPGQVEFTGRAQNLELTDLGSWAGLTHVKGKVNGLVKLNGSLNDPTLTATVQSTQVDLWGSTLKRLHGSFTSTQKNMALLVSTNWGPIKNATLKVVASHPDASWRIEQLELSQNKKRLVKADGFWSGPVEDTIAANIHANRLPLNLIPVLPPALNYLNGHISFDGQWTGRLTSPVFQGRFHTDALHYIGHTAIDARGKVSIAKDRIELKDIWVDGKKLYLTGSLNMGFSRVMTVAARFNGLRLDHLAGLLGYREAASVTGRLRGQVELNGPAKRLKSTGALTLANVHWGALEARDGVVNFSSSGDQFWLKEFRLRQKQGVFNAVLETGLDFDQGDFNLLVWMEHFEVAKRAWTGDLKIKGVHEVVDGQPQHRGSITLNRFKMDGRNLDALAGRFQFGRQVLWLKDLNWGRSITMNGQVQTGPRKQGQLNFSLKKADLSTLRSLLAPGRPPLHQPVSGEGQVNWSAAQSTLSTTLTLDKSRQLSATMALEGLGSGQPIKFKGHVKTQAVPLAWLLDMLLAETYEKAPRGNLTSDLTFSGKSGRLQTLKGRVSADQFKHGSWNFTHLQADLNLEKNQLTINDLEGRQAQGSIKAVKLTCQRNPKDYWTVDSGFEADHFNFLSRKFNGHLAVTGNIKLKPVYDMTLEVASQDFGIDLQSFGLLKAIINYQDKQVRIRTTPDLSYHLEAALTAPPDGALIFNQLQLQHAGKVLISGKGRIDGQGTSDILFDINDVGADIIAKTLGWPQAWTGRAFGSVHYTDPSKIPHFEIAVKIENGSVIDLPFDIFSGKILIDHDWLYFKGPQEGCLLQRTGKYNLKLSGKIPLPQTAKAVKAMEGEEMDVQVTMPQGDLDFLRFIPYIASGSGKSALALTVKGTMDYPSLNGTIRIENGTVYPRYYAPKIDHLFADLQINDNKLVARRFEGKVGEGRLVISAGKTKKWLTEFRRLVPHELNLHLQSRDGRIKLDNTEDFEFVSALADVDLTITGTLENPVLGGDLALSDGQFTFPAIPLTPFAKNVKGGAVSYDHLKLTSLKNLWFYKDVVRAQLAPQQSVVLNGDKYQFRGDGHIVVARGSMIYLNNEFTLDPNEATELIFRGKDLPRLSALTKTTIRNVQIKDEGHSRDAIIYLRVEGQVGALKLKLSSDPEMTQAQIMSLLTLGEDYSNWSQAELEQKIQTAGARVLGRLAGNLIGREIEKSIKKITPLDLDVIDIRLGGMEKLAGSIMSGSNTTNASTGSGGGVTGTSLLQDTQIDVGKYLTDDLFLNYRGILKEREADQGNLTWQSYLGLEYNIDPSRKIKVYKNFDTDSDQELFWGIEGRVHFDSWAPKEHDGNRRQNPHSVNPTPTIIPLD